MSEDTLLDYLIREVEKRVRIECQLQKYLDKDADAKAEQEEFDSLMRELHDKSSP